MYYTFSKDYKLILTIVLDICQLQYFMSLYFITSIYNNITYIDASLKLLVRLYSYFDKYNKVIFY